MASLARELTAGPTPPPAGRWSQYTQLSRQMKQAGLLERRRGWYAARIGLNLALLAAGCTAFAVLGTPGGQLVTAAYLAVVFTQLAFVATTPATTSSSVPSGPRPRLHLFGERRP